jgi:nitrogen-specific signal transduction histidine kinase
MPFASLRNRLILVVTAAILPIVLYLAFTSTREKNLAATALQTEALARARATAELLDDRMRTVNEMLDSAMMLVNSPGDRGPMQIVDSKPNPLASALSIAFLDSAGRRRRVLLGDGERVEAVPLRRRALLAAATVSAQRGKTLGAVTDLVEEGDEREPSDSIAMIVVRPVQRRTSACRCLADTVGVVVAVLSDKGMQSLLGSDALPANAVAVLMGRMKSIGRIARPTRWIDNFNSDPSVVAAGVQSEGSFVVRGLDDVERFVGFAKLARLPWRVFIGLPVASTSPLASHGARDAIALAVISLLIGIGGVLLALRGFANPLKRLIADIKHLAAGDLAHRSELAKNSGDIGAAGVALNVLAADLEVEREQTLQELERAMQVFEESPVAMWLSDASSATAQSGRITSANAAAAKLLGVPANALVGQRDDELIDAGSAHLLGAVSGGSPLPAPRQGNARLLAADRSRRECVLSVTHLDGGAHPVRLVTAQEVPSRATAEPIPASTSVPAAAAAAAAAPQTPVLTPPARVTNDPSAVTSDGADAASDHVVVDFAGRVADEFNEVLIGVAGFTQLALENTHDPDMQGMALKRIRELSGHGLDVARRMQSYGGRAMSSGIVVDVNATLADALSTLEGALQPDIELDLRYTSSPAVVRADPAMLHDAATALIVNAREAMPDGGTLTVATTFVEVPSDRGDQYAAAPGRYIVLTLADTGHGMTRETQARMFDPFFTTRERRGAGLGLAALAGIAREHGWVINVDSEVGVGTAISIYMPLAIDPI